jgi:hypothetical protein
MYDPYLEMVYDEWDHIMALYTMVAARRPVMLYDVQDRKIYAYPYKEFKADLNERSQAILTEQYEQARAKNAVVIFVRDNEKEKQISYTIPLEEEAKPMPEENVPKTMQAKYDQIVVLTDTICAAHLNDEYAQMSRKLAAKLSRKRPSPLVSGQAKSWACAIVYTIGQVSFLFDKSQDPHLSAAELCKLFGVSQQTGSAKARQIRDMLNIGMLEPEWTLLSMIDENPMVWMITVNGLIIDARSAPRAIQEEAYRRGFIPYIPGEKAED